MTAAAAQEKRIKTRPQKNKRSQRLSQTPDEFCNQISRHENWRNEEPTWAYKKSNRWGVMDNVLEQND